MKLWLALTCFALLLCSVSAASARYGYSISNHHPSFNFAEAKDAGAKFIIAKATEGSHTIDGQYLRSRTLARKSQLPTGASHFAHPNQGTGRQQAEWFVAHGGGWKPDGKTLPGTLDLSSGEPHGFGECWDMYDLQMQNWVEDFVDEYHDLTGMWPMIRVTSTWWYRCMMNTRSLRDKCPLVLAGHVQTKEERKNKKVEALPTAWGRVAMSQEPDVEISLSRATVLRTDKKSLRKLLKGKQ